MTLKFVIPKKDEDEFRYATWVEGYNYFKVHRDLGAAKQVFYGRAGGRWSTETSVAFKILHRVDGEWYVLYDIPKGTSRDELPWVKDVKYVTYSYGPGNTWEKQEKVTKKPIPITREEYAEFRIAVELERRGITE